MSSTSPFEFSCRLMAFSHLPFLRIRMEDGFILSANPAFENTFHHPFHRSLWDLLPSGAAGLLSGQWAALPDDDGDAAQGQAAGTWLSTSLSIAGQPDVPAALRLLRASKRLGEALLEFRKTDLSPESDIRWPGDLSMNFPGFLTAKDDKGRIIACSRRFSALLGLPPEDIAGKTFEELLAPDAAGKFALLEEQACGARCALTRNMTWRQSGDDAAALAVGCEPIFGRNADLAGFTYTAEDHSFRDAAAHSLARHERLLGISGLAAQNLLESFGGSIEKAVNRVLAMLGENLEADRAYIWLFLTEPVGSGNLFAAQMYEWSRNPEFRQEGEQGAHVHAASALPELLNMFRSGRGFRGSSRDLPPGERAVLDAERTFSIMLAPIFVKGELWGFIGADECRSARLTSTAEENFLRTMGNLIGMAMEGHAMRADIMDSNRELRRAVRNAELASRAKSEFLANMSHEIRTPLNAVLGLAHLARQELSPGKASDYLDKIDDAGKHLLHLINDVLDMSKLETGHVELEKEPFSLSRTAGGLVDCLVPRARESGLDLRLTIDADVPDRLIGDPLRLRQILANLVGNALKFTERGGVEIHVALAEGTDAGLSGDQIRLLISVKDSGIGIPAEARAHIFDSFRQADSSITRRFGGTGLGLAICVELVKLMRGTIACESEVGKGSTFQFTCLLERERPEKAAEAEKQAARPAEKTLAGRKILAVEDNEINRLILSSLLENRGLQATLAENGREALRLLDEAWREGVPFELVLMDVQMPEMDGLTATRRLREDERFRDVPVLAMTAHAFREDREKSLAAGMNAHLTKPISPDALYDELARWLP